MEPLVFTVAIVMGISFFCSLCEAVLYSVPHSYVELLSGRGTRSGLLLKRMRENIARPISALLTLDTLGDTFGSVFVGALIVAALGERWLAIFSGAYAVAILFFCKVVPKTLGVKYARALARVVSWPMEVLIWILWPITLASSWITRWVGATNHHSVSAEEIQIMAHLGRKTGALGGMEESVIANILNLRHVRARDIMTPRTVVFSLNKDLTLREVRDKASQWPWPHSRVPVHEGELDRIAGVVHRREVLLALAEGKEGVRLSEIMRPVHLVPDVATADVLLQQFIERREHLFVVLDEYGGVAGVVTLEDVFETILGQEIVDETDIAEDMQRLALQQKKRRFGGS